MVEMGYEQMPPPNTPLEPIIEAQLESISRRNVLPVKHRVHLICHTAGARKAESYELDSGLMSHFGARPRRYEFNMVQFNIGI